MTIPRFGTAQVKLLERLSNACSVSGDEGEVRKIILKELRPYIDDIRVDDLGNILAVRQGQEEGRLGRVMLAAHMDEVGFMLVHQEDRDEGIFRFDIVGGVIVSHLAGQPVWIGTEHVPGVIGAKPVHLTTGEEVKNPLSIDSLRIDVGPGNGSRVKVGDRATYATRFARTGSSLCGKAVPVDRGSTRHTHRCICTSCRGALTGLSQERQLCRDAPMTSLPIASPA